MFLVLILAFLIPLGVGVWPLFDGNSPKLVWLLSSVLPGVGVGAVIAQMVNHPHGVKDWTQGGVVDLRGQASQMEWLDWAIVLTRHGRIDLRGQGRLQLERGLFFNLIPLPLVDRPLTDFHRTELNVTDTEDEWGNTVSLDYSLNLVDRRANRLCLLDLTTGDSSRGAEFMVTMAAALGEVINPEASARRSASGRLPNQRPSGRQRPQSDRQRRPSDRQRPQSERRPSDRQRRPSDRQPRGDSGRQPRGDSARNPNMGFETWRQDQGK